jgi:ADP-heptose:LPS heptosyltransferase
MASRWPIRVLSAGLAVGNVLLGLSTRRAPPKAVRRILVAHHMLLGDTIMLAPLLKKLRSRFPDAEILMTCRPAFVELFAGRPYGVRVVPFDPRRASTFWSLYRARGFDLALLPADNRYSWLARSVDSRWIVAFEGDRPAYKNWLVDDLRPYPDHVVAFGDLIAERLADGPAPMPYRPTDWPAPPAAEFATPPAPYCVLHVGARTPLRLWEAGKWRDLIAHLEASGTNAVLSSGPGEGNLVEEIDPDGRLMAYPGTLTLAQLWRLFAGAVAVVCPDTGVSHLARLVSAPLVVLFGPGSAAMFGGGEFWRTVPDQKVTIPKFPCRDDNIVFRRHLPWAEHCARTPAQCATPRCMQALTVDMVVRALESILSERRAVAQSGPSTAAS